MSGWEPASVSVSRSGSTRGDGGVGCAVVWLRGDHDLSTTVSLAVAIARAARRERADLLVDLGEVTFMDASTVGVLVGSRNRLRGRGQSLHVRAPSPPARRILDLCGLADLVLPAASDAVPPTGASTRPDREPVEPTPSEPRQPSRPILPARAQGSRAGASRRVDRGGP